MKTTGSEREGGFRCFEHVDEQDRKTPSRGKVSGKAGEASKGGP